MRLPLPTLSFGRLACLLGLVFLLGVAVTFRHEVLGCTRCDTTTYLAMGHAFVEHGVLSDTPDSKGRLYGYPLVIAGLIRLAGATGIDLDPLIVGFQSALYLGLALWLARLLRQAVSPAAGKLTLAALLLNALVWPYLALPLTDGFSLILEIAIIGILAELFFKPALVQSTARLFLLTGLLGGLFGFAVMVRPANIQFTGFIAPALLGLHLCQTPRRWCRLPLMAAGTGVGFALAVAPQLWFNWYYYQQLTFLPVYQLGTYQMEAGRNMLKYGTAWPEGGLCIGYPNPWAKLGRPAGSDLAWYFLNPLYGAKTILMHVFGAVDFDYYYPYNKLHRSKTEFWTVLASQAMVYGGAIGWLAGVCRLWQAWRTSGWSAATCRWLFPAGLSLAILGSWLAIYAFSAVENRFGLPLLALALPWALWIITRPQTGWQRLAYWQGFALYFLLAWQANNLLNALPGLPH